MPEIILAKDKSDYTAAATLFSEYAQWLNIDLSFQHFDEELSDLKNMYGTKGGIILYKEDNHFIACVAIRKMTNQIAELKRMYVQPLEQHKGIGKILLEKALKLAADNKYAIVRLDTLDHMTAAISLYKKYGFYEIEPYYYNPEKGAVFFEKIL